jgi:hypothetical protein
MKAKNLKAWLVMVKSKEKPDPKEKKGTKDVEMHG